MARMKIADEAESDLAADALLASLTDEQLEAGIKKARAELGISDYFSEVSWEDSGVGHPDEEMYQIVGGVPAAVQIETRLQKYLQSALNDCLAEQARRKGLTP